MEESQFEIQECISTDDDIGGRVDIWKLKTIVDGFLDMLTGSDIATLQKAIVQESTHILIVPEYRADITDDMRVVFNGYWYSITFVDDPVGQHDHLEIYLKSGGIIDG